MIQNLARVRTRGIVLWYGALSAQHLMGIFCLAPLLCPATRLLLLLRAPRTRIHLHLLPRPLISPLCPPTHCPPAAHLPLTRCHPAAVPLPPPDPARPQNAVPHMALAGMTGLSSMLITAIYNVGLAVAYGPSRLYAAPVAAAGGTWSHIAAVAPLLVLNNGLHAWSYFSMLNSIGAVSAGIMKGPVRRRGGAHPPPPLTPARQNNL